MIILSNLFLYLVVVHKFCNVIIHIYNLHTVEGKCLARAQPARDKRCQFDAIFGRTRPCCKTSAPSPSLPLPRPDLADGWAVGIYEGSD